MKPIFAVAAIAVSIILLAAAPTPAPTNPGKGVWIQTYFGLNGTASNIPANGTRAIYAVPAGQDLLVHRIDVDKGRPIMGGTTDRWALRLDAVDGAATNRGEVLRQAAFCNTDTPYLNVNQPRLVKEAITLTNLTGSDIADVTVQIVGTLVVEE